VVSFGLVEAILRLRGLAMLPLLTRLLGPEGYGLMAPLLALAGLSQSLAVLGVSSSIKTFIPGQPFPGRSREFWGVAQLTWLLGLALAVLLLVSFHPLRRLFLPAGTTFWLFLSGVIIIPVGSLQTVLYAQINNNREGRAYSRVVLAYSLVEIPLLLLGAFHLAAVGVLWASALARALLCGGMIRIILRQDRFTPLTGSVAAGLKRYYTYGLVLFVAGLASTVVDSSDRLVIAAHLGVRELGVYEVTYSLCSQLHHLSVPLFAVLMPFLAQAVNTGQAASARPRIRQSHRALWLIYVPAVVLLSLCGRDILSLITTREFSQGAVLIPFVAGGVALFQLGGVYNYNIVAHRRGHLLLVSLVSGGMVNLGLNLLLIPAWGVAAAAWSTAAAYALIFLIDRFFSTRLLRADPEPAHLGRIALAGAGMSILVLGLQHLLAGGPPLLRTALAGLAGGGLYLLLALRLNLITREERTLLLQALRRSVRS